jgi:pseudouridine kinase
VCWSLMQDGEDLELACRRGLKLSALTLGVAETVHPRLGPDSLADVSSQTAFTMNTNTQD